MIINGNRFWQNTEKYMGNGNKLRQNIENTLLMKNVSKYIYKKILTMKRKLDKLEKQIQ